MEKLIIENPVVGNQVVIKTDVEDPSLKEKLELIRKHIGENFSPENISGK